MGKYIFLIGSLGNEALIVTKDGSVYGLGTNVSGCLGTGDVHNTLFPKKIEALCDKGIKYFAYGSGPHVLALSNKGEVSMKIYSNNFYLKIKISYIYIFFNVNPLYNIVIIVYQS